MKLEAIVVCLQYSDFLRATLPHNKQFFNKIVVVTSPLDYETQRLCEFHNVQCVKTNAFYEDHPTIPNKAKGINVGLKHLQKDGWVLHLDADIWLPVHFRNILERYPLREECLYGIDRMMVNSYQEWDKYIRGGGKPMHEAWCYLHLNIFRIGERIVQYNDYGYVPIGFFQLWNPKGSGVHKYPVDIEGFDRTDVLFAKKFPRHNRDFIPDLACFHLASEVARQGQNWKGRKTKYFGPEHNKESCIIKFFKSLFHHHAKCKAKIKHWCRKRPKKYCPKD